MEDAKFKVAVTYKLSKQGVVLEEFSPDSLNDVAAVRRRALAAKLSNLHLSI